MKRLITDKVLHILVENLSFSDYILVTKDISDLEVEIEKLKNIPNKIKEYLKQVHIETQNGILSNNNLIWENIKRLCDGKNIIGSDKE